MLQPAVIAHRGFAGVAPENTVAAVETAIDRGADGVEIDVRPAADGTPVVFHDDRLDGRRDGEPITDGEGLVRETPLEAVRSAEVLGSGEFVPTLAELLDAASPTAIVNVELKSPGAPGLRPAEALPAADRDERRAVWQGFVDRVVADCDAFGGEVLFSSFCEGAIAAVREAAPAYAAASIAWDSLEDALEVARRYDCEAIHTPRTAIAGTPLATEPYGGLPADEPAIDVVETAHEEGRAVNVWTVDTWHQFTVLAEAGVDGIVVEYPGLGAFSR